MQVEDRRFALQHVHALSRGSDGRMRRFVQKRPARLQEEGMVEQVPQLGISDVPLCHRQHHVSYSLTFSHTWTRRAAENDEVHASQPQIPRSLDLEISDATQSKRLRRLILCLPHLRIWHVHVRSLTRDAKGKGGPRSMVPNL